MIEVGILGTGSYSPEKVLTNADLEKMVDTSDEWIRTRTGIEERHIMEPGMYTADLAEKAAAKALANAGVKAEELDLIIVATVTADTLSPSLACVLQERLGAVNAAAFDVGAGCSGYVYALSIGCNLMRAGMYKKVLVVGAEYLTRFVDWTDRNTCILFGDGAGAAVLGVTEEAGYLVSELGADGSGASMLGIFGGVHTDAAHEDLRGKKMRICMNGKEVFKFAVNTVEESVGKMLAKCGLTAADVALFIPHQANWRIIKTAAKKIGFEDEQVLINVNRYGNTSSASIGIALDEAVREQRLRRGDVVVLAGFGAGLTWATAVFKWLR